MSFSTDFKRIVRSGFVTFWRNGTVSLASILVMSITLFVIGSLVFLNAILGFSLEQIQKRVDVNVYFYPVAPEERILELKDFVEGLPEVTEVTYVSRDQAIEEFRERHKDNYLTLQALDELGDNPLGASLNVRAVDPSHYEGIAQVLSEENLSTLGFGSYIEQVNYNQNKLIIDRLTIIINTSRALGVALTIILIVISIIITLNTVRLAIYSSREEIGIMRIVGAENTYIRGPFMVEGILHGVISAIITAVVFYPLTYWAAGHTRAFFGGLDIFHYYINNFPQFFIIMAGAGILLGAFSSFLAVRKYLKT